MSSVRIEKDRRNRRWQLFFTFLEKEIAVSVKNSVNWRTTSVRPRTQKTIERMPTTEVYGFWVLLESDESALSQEERDRLTKAINSI